MLLSSSGQNIYPEEIEALLNMEPGVMESLVVQRDNKLVALIVPASKKVRKTRIEHAVKQVNNRLPQYSKIISYEIRQDEFEKTPKKSIKRFLYS
jgi:long-chain acyl-CoA synthetase